MDQKPTIIMLPKIGSSDLGYISVGENSKNIPFDIKRVYWTYYTPQDVTRGGHAHLILKQVIVAVSGIITFTTEDLNGNKQEFILDSPDKGLFIPEKIWRDIKFSHSAVLLCLASEKYTEDDYIRDYEIFSKLKDERKNS
ncbi:sugar 3,4-ketoisomerase [Kaistella palustris]|uniref:sugar 3,4-ketoisomerase n=1 Tax=Kaistella palustris TaxID=493376 RepID=UPI0003F76284|nr:FdtA/QdtA family cupin domain-containing protein [Kaistella palustris]